MQLNNRFEVYEKVNKFTNFMKLTKKNREKSIIETQLINTLTLFVLIYLQI
jgi:hypothetical protein